MSIRRSNSSTSVRLVGCVASGVAILPAGSLEQPHALAHTPGQTAFSPDPFRLLVRRGTVTAPRFDRGGIQIGPQGQVFGTPNPRTRWPATSLAAVPVPPAATPQPRGP